MRNATHSGKDLAGRSSFLRISSRSWPMSATATPYSRVAWRPWRRPCGRPLWPLRTATPLRPSRTTRSKIKERATNVLSEQTEARPLTMLTATIGIGFVADWLSRRR